MKVNFDSIQNSAFLFHFPIFYVLMSKFISFYILHSLMNYFGYACMSAKSSQSCLTLWDTWDHISPGSSVHGVLQARILEWVAMPSSRWASLPREEKPVSLRSPALAGLFFTTRVPGKPYFSCNNKAFVL